MENKAKQPSLSKGEHTIDTSNRNITAEERKSVIKPNKSQIIVKNKANDTPNLAYRKRLKVDQCKVSCVDSRDVNDFEDTSFSVSEDDNNYTTPEYLYNEILNDEENEDADCVILESDEINNTEHHDHVTNINTPSLSEIDLDEVNYLGEESSPINVKLTDRNTSAGASKVQKQEWCNMKQRSSNLSNIQKNSLQSTKNNTELSTISTPKAAYRHCGANTSNKNAAHKPIKISDKFPDLPVPTNINQYGDCLKTRLGRYHYGLTLTDPPCQFFQGVLKGATGQTLAAMFGDINLISKFESVSLDEIGHFIIDTTFRVIPTSTVGVNQVMTINLLFQNQTIPLWYAITSCSSTELYKRILIEFQQHVLHWPFTSFLLNNDPALCKAVLAVFPDVELYGSWFHYCYSIWREVTLNNLVERCRTDNTLMTAVKMLLVVPYLPPITEQHSSVTMLEGFEFVRQFAREKSLPKEFSRVLDYVATFWFNTVKSENFSVYGKQTYSLNFVEIFQLSLLSYMKPNGNVWTLTHSFQNVARTANAEFNRYLNGKPPLTKKNRGKKFNVPIRQNIKKLLMGTLDVKTYLEKSTIYCEEMLDIFLHPLYPSTTCEKSNYFHTEGWKTKIIDT